MENTSTTTDINEILKAMKEILESDSKKFDETIQSLNNNISTKDIYSPDYDSILVDANEFSTVIEIMCDSLNGELFADEGYFIADINIHKYDTTSIKVAGVKNHISGDIHIEFIRLEKRIFNEDLFCLKIQRAIVKAKLSVTTKHTSMLKDVTKSKLIKELKDIKVRLDFIKFQFPEVPILHEEEFLLDGMIPPAICQLMRMLNKILY